MADLRSESLRCWDARSLKKAGHLTPDLTRTTRHAMTLAGCCAYLCCVSQLYGLILVVIAANLNPVHRMIEMCCKHAKVIVIQVPIVQMLCYMI